MIYVCILTHNRRDQLEQLLNSPLLWDWHDMEVLVVNQGSTDGSEMFLASMLPELPRLHIINSIQNPGIIVGHQRQIDWLLGHGLKHDDVVIMLDDDARPVRHGWIEELINPILSTRDIAITGAYGVFVDERYHLTAPPSEPQEVDIVSNSHTAYAGHLFTGGCEFHYRLGTCWHEDSDLCMQAKARGFKVWYVGTPESIGLHHDSHHKTIDAQYRANWNWIKRTYMGRGLTLHERGEYAPTK